MKIKSKFFILLLPIFLFSCKSIKKDKLLRTTNNIEVSRNIDTSIKKQDLKIQVQENNKETVKEEREESYQVLVVNGQEVIKPIVKTTITTERNGVKFSEETKTDTQDDVILKENANQNKTKDLDLYKESEGIEVVKEIINGIFDGVLGGTSKKIIALILTLIMIPIFIRVYRKLKAEGDADNKTNRSNK